MKKLYPSVLAILACLGSFAATITAKSNGDWFASVSWDLGRVPKNGDIIIIPVGFTITVTNGVTTPISNAQLNVYGTLSLSVNKTILAFTSSSILVSSSATEGIIRSGNTGSNSQDVTLNGTTVFPTTGSNKNQQISYNQGTFVPLPVKFTGFSVARQNSDVLVQWATAEEVNADSYIIERSTDGSNWTGLTTVAARGNTSSLTNYTYIDKNVTAAIAYYRVKQVDIDGRYTYTATQAIKAGAAAVDVKVAAINNRVVLQFSKEVKGTVEVRLVSLGGQVLSREVLHQPVGQVVLNTPVARGRFIVSVSNGQDIQVARQVSF